MKKFLFLVATLSVSASFAAKHSVPGSDTLAGVMTDTIVAAGMDQEVVYTGGGSGVGEKALANGEVGLTAMSREIKPEIQAQMRSAGVEVVGHVIALDGLALFVNKGNILAGMDMPTIAKIFTCEIKSWSDVPGSGRSGAIKVYRRNDNSGTTDSFKHFFGIKKFGDCVVVVNETIDIAERTSKEPDAVGYAGLSGAVNGNRAIAVSKTGTAFVQPATGTIRDGSYPLTRSLYIYEVKGQRQLNAVESKLMGYLTDRSFLDPIVQDHDFITLN
jgi:phosphate transport system substrate-binding protein